MPVHLIRHGEVDNPGGIVYADIPGFALSPRGRNQADAAGKYLAEQPPRVIVSSPLERAIETSQRIAGSIRADVVTDPRLTEWALLVRWRGTTWADLPRVFPGELEAYLEDPYDLPFSQEPIARVAARVTSAVTDWVSRTDGGIALVSHQDPIHAAYLQLTNSSHVPFHNKKPQHCTVLTLRAHGQTWQPAARWDPPQ